ncbi:class I SAM-dependent methyltransferase [Marinobacteraceae bacterium S3BR75-40.1]
MSEAPHPICIVCHHGSPVHFMEVDRRTYWRCPACLATFLDPTQQPGRKEEYAEYCHHENELDDPGYRRFLSRLAEPLFELLPEEAHGLDYGCGPGPALAAMAAERGYEVSLYDPLFRYNQAALMRRFDFVTCTEVWEHFHHPFEQFRVLDRLLRPGGWLGVMTQFQTEDARFANWQYRRDPTHVVFYRRETLERVAAMMGWECRIPEQNVALFHKPCALASAG